MDIKLKKYKSLLLWLCFFLGINMAVPCVAVGIALSRDIYNNLNEIREVMTSDIKDMRRFKHTMTLKFDHLARVMAEESVRAMERLEGEGENLIYYAENVKNRKILTNSSEGSNFLETALLAMPEGYDYYLYFNGEKFTLGKDGKAQEISRDDPGYSNLKAWGYMSPGTPGVAGIEDMRILLVVKKDIVKNPYGESSIYHIKEDAQKARWVVIGFIAALVSGTALLVFAFIKRSVKREIDRELAAFSGKLWFEVKAAVSLLALVLLTASGVWNFRYSFISSPIKVLAVVACFWWFYIMLLDLLVNRRKFFSKNTVNLLINAYRSFERKKSFQKALLLRAYVFIAVEAVIALFAGILFAYIAAGRGGGKIYLALMFFTALGVYIAYRYLRRYSSTVNDIGKVVDQIEAVKSGDMSTKLLLNPDADMYFAAENMNRIQDGISSAVEEKVKSERMKIELITNVSHDLKTPLTSIISYVDLLAREEELPEHVKDYIRILCRKSERLKVLIEDLFDLARASSGNMKVDKERLDMGKLIRQTLADLDEQVVKSEMAFRLNIPEEPLFIINDGKKLYRVFQNLFSNTLKYSLKGSRIYVDLIAEEDKIVVIVKNTANYEMNFSEEEIQERFVRGDKARSTEGSGLGLAIAKSFAQSCGGSFDIQVDGDQFKVKLGFYRDNTSEVY